jgi:hypothetical protein
MTVLYFLSRDSSVGIATGYRLDGRVRDKRFSLLHNIETSSGAHPATYPMVSGVLTSGVKQPGHEADHSPPWGAKVN